MARLRLAVLLVMVGALAATVAACNSGGSSGSRGGGIPRLLSAIYSDANSSGSLDADDLLTVRFSATVSVAPGAIGNQVFLLSPTSDTVGGGNMINVSPTEVQLTIDGTGSFQPNGVFGLDATSTGLNMDTNQTGITYGVALDPVAAEPTAVDIGGSLNPKVVDAVYVDNGACRAGPGDPVDLTFSTDVNVLGSPTQAFQDIPATTNPFGTGASYSGSTTSVLTVSISVGNNPDIVVNGIFDPLVPTAGPSGIDVGAAIGQIVDASFPGTVFARPITPDAGVDIGGSLVAKITMADYTDVGSDGLNAGDTIRVTFCRAVDIISMDPNVAFTLLVLNDTFGTGASFAAPTPPTATVFADIILGANPVLQVNGVFDPLQIGAGFSSGIDAGVSQIRETGAGPFLVPPAAVDIGGIQIMGRWIPVLNPMMSPRVGHTATLLNNGEILIAGGFDDQTSPTNPAFRRSLATMEIFDPSSGAFTLKNSLDRPRVFHNAVLVPGLDNLMGTNDEYVIMIGGWNSEMTDNGGPHTESSAEVVIPDPNSDGDTSDLVVNPFAGWEPPGTPMASGTPPFELGTSLFQGAGPGGTDVDIPIGFGLSTFHWLPEFYGSAATASTTGRGLGDNEMMAIGGFASWIWDAAAGAESLYFVFYCGGFRPWITIDADEDGDFFDNDVPNSLFDGMYLGGIGTGGTTPVSLTRFGYGQVRIAGFDGTPGTADDVLTVYGGESIDLTGFCQGPGTCFSIAGELEFFSRNFGPVLTQVNPGFQSCDSACANCGLECTGPGNGATDRTQHVMVYSGNANQEILVAGGFYTAFGIADCGQAVEIITPDVVSPTPINSTMTYGGLDALRVRSWHHRGAALEGTSNVMFCGGVDQTLDATTASAQYVLMNGSGIVAPSPDMSQPRDNHALVEYPASLGFFTEDRIYVFGGWDRPSGAGSRGPLAIHDEATVMVGTASATAEYFTEN